MKHPYDAEPITAGELRNKLKGVSNNTPVFVVVDKDDANYDENGYLRLVHPVDSVQRELIYDVDSDEPERNLIIHLNEAFYLQYECRQRPPK